MTPAEQRLMREMLREALRSELDPIAARIAALEQRDKELEADDRKLSGQHRFVLKQALPQLQTNLSQERADDLKAISIAFTRMSTFVGDLSEKVARIESHSNLSLVQVPDGKGGQSVKPASMLAAESAQRTEGKTDALAVDTTATAEGVRSIKSGQKFLLPVASVATLASAAPYVIEIVKAIWHSLH